MEITKIAPLGPFRIYRRKPFYIWLWVCCSMWSFSPIGNHLTRVLGAAVCRSGCTIYLVTQLDAAQLLLASSYESELAAR